MSKLIPDFDLLRANYPAGDDPAAVKRDIGGEVDAAWITNTCVVRLSHALNYAGDPIPKGYPGLLVVRGGDSKHYALRVREFRRYMEREYSAPQLRVHRTARGNVSPAAFTGSRGIIGFEVKVWNDATGHFTLWDGNACLHGDYFDKAEEVWLWSYQWPGDYPSPNSDYRYA
jgi:hypothetical protein